MSRVKFPRSGKAWHYAIAKFKGYIEPVQLGSRTGVAIKRSPM